jgi:hypothetical protein
VTKPESVSAPEVPTAAGLPEPEFAARAVSQVLRPLTRLMIDHGLQLPTVVELLKKALVDEAAQTFALDGKDSSDSRIALLTGVHRKDVKRLRTEAAGPVDPESMASLGAMVVARWISDPRFLSADQSPRPLARTPKRGGPGEPNFTDLVAEISRDVGARAVLDELERLSVVELRDDGYAVLRSSAFLPQEGLSESFHFLATNVADHLAAAVHNLAPARHGSPLLEQSAFAEDLSSEQAQQLQERARQLWAGVLKQFLQTATVAWQRSEGTPGPKHRVRFGVYFHDSEQSTGVDSDNAKAKSRSKQSGDRNRKPKA